MSDWTNRYKKALSALNTDQKLAVKTTEGALMVLAGPGTGKTQVVALRIAYILHSTQMDPSNILALTFTEAGVTSLRKRLISIIGPTAYKVNIATFHGFSNEVIAIFPHLFTETKELRQISDAERFLLIEEILNSNNSLKTIRPLRKPDLYVGEISQKIKILKQESTPPKQLEKFTKKINDKKQKEKLVEFAQVYSKYNEELKVRGWYDYEDTISLVVDALNSNDEVRSYFQEKYQYIHVDEYQDTNNSQNRLVEELASFYKDPNLFVVGDDKQAIYRFQGASIANMLHFKTKYPHMKVVNLKKNYRSSPEILSSADKLISNNKNQIEKIVSSKKVKLITDNPSTALPTVYRTNSEFAHYRVLIDLIKKYSKNGTPLSSIAVLWRRRNDARNFVDLLLKSNIQVSGQPVKQIFNEPSVDLLIKILKAVNNPDNNINLIAALRQTLDDKSLVELYKINRTSRRISLIVEKTVKASSNLRKEVGKILEAHRLSDTVTVQELVEWISVNTILFNKIFTAKNLPGIESLLAFYNLSKNFSRQENNDLKSFLSFIEMVRQRNIDVPIPKLLPEEGVYVGTVHSTKGMEFDRVIIAGVDEKKWGLRKRPELIKLPSEVIGLNDWEDDLEEDERRLFYVAATRAKKSLDLTYSEINFDNTEVLQTKFVEELGETGANSDKSSKQSVLNISKKVLSPIQLEVLSEQQLSYSRHLINTSPFSYSDLRAYNMCPKQYYLSRVLRLPQPESEALIYGNVVHGALESLFREFKGYSSLPTKDRFIEFIDESVTRNAPPRLRESIYDHSLKVLSEYYDEKAPQWQIPVGIEYSFTHHNVRLKDIWLTGKFDRIDVVDKTTRSVRLVDYKTKSRAISRNEIEGKTKNSDGSIKKQLVFYGLLAKNDSMFPYNAKEFMISTIDDTGKFKDEIIEISTSEILDLEKEIISTKSKILKLKSFEHTRSLFDMGCELCEIYS